MSYGNRKEDIEKILNMKVGEELELNMFQDGGSEVRRVSPYTWELYEITNYGVSTLFHQSYIIGDIDKLVDVIYDEFT